MPSTYSSLKIELMAAGEKSNTWGDITNTNLGTALEEAITGSVDVTFASADITLALTDTNTTQAARNLRLNCTGTTGAARNLVVPAIKKFYVVNNGCAHTITVKNATGTGVAVPAGQSMMVFNNATNVVDAMTGANAFTVNGTLTAAGGISGTTGTFSGAATASTFTATSTGNTALVMGSNSAIRDTTNGASIMYFDVSTSGATHGAFNFRSSNAFTNRFYIDSLGRVGINTGTPTQQLSVYTDSTARNHFGLTDTATGGKSWGIGPAVGSGLPGRFSIYNYTDGQNVWSHDNTNGHLFAANGVTQGQIDAAGNLNVYGSTITTGYYVSTGNALMELGGGRTGSGNALIDFHGASGTDYEARIIRGAGANGDLILTNSGAGNFYIKQESAAPIYFQIGNVTKTSITSAGALIHEADALVKGNFYLGTTGLVNFAGDTTSIYARTDNFAWQTKDAASTRMYLTSGGDLGIGTTSPQGRLEVRKDTASGPALAIIRNNATGSGAVSALTWATGTLNSYVTFSVVDGNYRQISNGAGVISAYDDADYHNFRKNDGTVKMTMDASGNMGVLGQLSAASLNPTSPLALNKGGTGASYASLAALLTAMSGLSIAAISMSSTSGYIKLTNGTNNIMLAWVQVACAAGGSATATFPQTFSATPFAIPGNVSGLSFSGSLSTYIGAGSLSASGCTVYANNGGSVTTTVGVFAIGTY